MALYRLSASFIKRSAGRSAVAASAYRSGEHLADERRGLSYDYTRKRGVEHSEIMAPDNAPDWMRDRAQLWNAVEAVEKRKNSQLAREITLALPHEMDADQRRDLVRQYVGEQFVANGMIADIAIHQPHRLGDQRNHHAHVMLTLRELTAEGFHEAKATPTARSWSSKQQLETWRTEWAAIQNREFERLGIDAQVDHRSLQAQGIDREPQRRDGPAVTNMRRRGELTHKDAERERLDAANDNRATLHAELLKVQAELDRIKAEQAALVAEKHAQLSAERDLSDLARSQAHDQQSAELETQLEAYYGESLRTVKREAETIQGRLDNPGFLRRALRDFTGRTRADRERLDALNLTMDDTHTRMQEARRSWGRLREGAVCHAKDRGQAIDTRR